MVWSSRKYGKDTTQKMKFSIRDFFIFCIVRVLGTCRNFKVRGSFPRTTKEKNGVR